MRPERECVEIPVHGVLEVDFVFKTSWRQNLKTVFRSWKTLCSNMIITNSNPSYLELLGLFTVHTNVSVTCKECGFKKLCVLTSLTPTEVPPSPPPPPPSWCCLKCVSPEGCVRAQGRWPKPTMTNWGNASKTCDFDFSCFYYWKQ